MRYIDVTGYLTLEKQIFFMQVGHLLSQEYKVLLHLPSDLTRTILSKWESPIVEIKGVDLCADLSQIIEKDYDFIFTTELKTGLAVPFVLWTQHYLDHEWIKKHLHAYEVMNECQMVFIHWSQFLFKRDYAMIDIENIGKSIKFNEIAFHSFDEKDFALVNDYLFDLHTGFKGYTKPYKHAILQGVIYALEGDEEHAKQLVKMKERVK